jgi:hypothetical protein
MRIRNLMIATECASYGPGARPLRPSLAAAAVASDGPDSPGVAVAGEAGSNVTVAKAATPGGAAAAAAVKRLVGGVAAAAASAPFGAPSRAAVPSPRLRGDRSHQAETGLADRSDVLQWR